MTLPDAFFEPTDAPDRFVATALTRGPWSASHQHGGPPAALLGRAIERDGEDAGDFRVARVAVEMLRPVPIGPLRVQLESLRRGKQAQWLQASLLGEGDVLLARATGVRIRRVEVALPPAKDPPASPLPSPHAIAPFVFPFFAWEVAYHRAVEVRIARGRWRHEPTAGWLRSLVPLVRGEPDSPLVRLLVTADAVNGIALVLDTARYTFINPDLTAVTARDPEGEWIGFDTHATADPGGTGLTHATVHDTRGPVGHCLQSLVVRAR